MQRSFDPTTLGRSVDVVLFRLTKSAAQLRSACGDQAQLRLLDDAAVLNLLSLKRPLVVNPGNLQPSPASSLRPGADAILYLQELEGPVRFLLQRLEDPVPMRPRDGFRRRRSG